MSKRYNFKTQSVGLDSLFNARELGGYVLPEGTVRRGCLIRAGALSTASFADLKKLHDVYHLTHVFDFRSSMEVDKAPDKPVDGATYIWLPAFDEEAQTMEKMCLPNGAYVNLVEWCVKYGHQEKTQNVARQMYPEMVINEFTQVQYAGFLQNVLNAPDGAVMWHCSQGKDRTGLAAAFLLGALGADRKMILDDYVISNEFYEDIIEQTCKRVSTQGEKDVIMTFVGVNVKYFSAALDIIDQKWGSLHNYIVEALMFSEEDMRALRKKYLE